MTADHFYKAIEGNKTNGEDEVKNSASVEKKANSKQDNVNSKRKIREEIRGREYGGGIWCGHDASEIRGKTNNCSPRCPTSWFCRSSLIHNQILLNHATYNTFIFCRFSLSKQCNTSSCSSKFSFESNQIKSKTFLFYERDWEWEWWQPGNSKPTQKVVIVDQISLSDCGLNDGEKDTSDNHFNYFSYFLPSYSIL